MDAHVGLADMDAERAQDAEQHAIQIGRDMGQCRGEGAPHGFGQADPDAEDADVDIEIADQRRRQRLDGLRAGDLLDGAVADVLPVEPQRVVGCIAGLDARPPGHGDERRTDEPCLPGLRIAAEVDEIGCVETGDLQLGNARLRIDRHARDGGSGTGDVGKARLGIGDLDIDWHCDLGAGERAAATEGDGQEQSRLRGAHGPALFPDRQPA